MPLVIFIFVLGHNEKPTRPRLHTHIYLTSLNEGSAF